MRTKFWLKESQVKIIKLLWDDNIKIELNYYQDVGRIYLAQDK